MAASTDGLVWPACMSAGALGVTRIRVTPGRHRVRKRPPAVIACHWERQLGMLRAPAFVIPRAAFLSQGRWYVARFAGVSVEVFADLRADVGEAPHWDERASSLLFVDLTGGTVYRYDRSGAKVGSFSAGQEVGAAVPRRGGGLVLAVRDGIAVASEDGEGFALTAPVERGIPGNRMNDAKCDPAGR